MNSFRNTRVLTTAALLLATSAAMAQTQTGVTPACDRACLTRVVDTYVAGLIANDPARVPFAPNAKLTLNDDVVAAGKLFWDQAASVQARIDIANPRWGDTGTQLVITNADGSQYIYAFRLKVKNARITEAEAMLIRNVEEGGLWDLKTLQKANPNFNVEDPPGRAGLLLRPGRGSRRLLARLQHQRHSRIPSRTVLAQRAAAGKRLPDHQRSPSRTIAPTTAAEQFDTRRPCRAQHLGSCAIRWWMRSTAW